jgi:hypothetical protein
MATRRRFRGWSRACGAVLVFAAVVLLNGVPPAFAGTTAVRRASISRAMSSTAHASAGPSRSAAAFSGPGVTTMHGRLETGAKGVLTAGHFRRPARNVVPRSVVAPVPPGYAAAKAKAARGPVPRKRVVRIPYPVASPKARAASAYTAGSSPPLMDQVQFIGLTFDNSAPPDTDIAAGFNEVVETTNTTATTWLRCWSTVR